VLNVFAILLIIAAVISSNMDLFVAIYDRFRVLLFDSSGRMDLYQEAINQFLAHPLLGAGIYARLDETGGLRMYHNTILHTAASFGILGLLALGWQFVVSFQIMMHQIKTKTTILALSLLFANLHGMVDNVYYMPQFMILFFVILAVTEVSNQHYDRTLERALS
ncbi:MAG: O-antigen ligase family protein, partial [Candidatus Izemoplasmatales bacterium]|nr:O-antigen ligase family protein [Candidatus Izemoplasmatales bacterium]